MDQSTGKPLPQSTRATGGGQMARDDQDLYLFSSDNDALKLKILGTHAPSVEELNVKPVLSIAEDIMSLAKPLSAGITDLGAQVPSHSDTSDDVQVRRNSDPVAEIVIVLEYPINYTSYVITWKYAGGIDSHSVTMELLESLSNYSWDAKAVITYAAFAINYGEFWLVHQLQDPKNQLADSLATLMGFPDEMALGEQLEMELKAVLDLLTAVLKVTHCIIEFKEIPSMYISRQSPDIPIAVYWVIRSLLVCASTITSLFGDYEEYITKTSAAARGTLLSLAGKLSAILQHLQKQLKICKDLIERQKAEDEYVEFMNRMESGRLDNMKVLRAMISSRENQTPLYNGSKQTSEPLEVLRRKYVLVLISDLKLPHEVINILNSVYNQQSMRHEYDVLWLPIVDPTKPMTSSQDAVFSNLRENMSWYSVDHPSLVKPLSIRYIREAWKFVNMPILVVLDPHGRVSNRNALPMMWLWGGFAFPFTHAWEVTVWADVTWNIDLLASAVDPRIPEWIRDNKIICLYGGDDIAWIRKFTRSARAVGDALHIPLEMLYVGKPNPKDDKVKVGRCHEVINRSKLSHTFPDDDYVWHFWIRISSMFNSRKQLGKTPENDDIMREITEVLNFDRSDEGWAVFSRGNYEMTKANGDKVLFVLERNNEWRDEVDRPDKFVTILDEEFSCFRGYTRYVPEKLVCSECGKTMDKYIMYHCCN